MSVKSIKIAEMVDMLPEDEQNLAFEFIKRMILAWDPDFTKLTPAEKSRIKEAESGEFIRNEDIDWENLSQY